MKNDVLIKKFSIPSSITIEKPHVFKPSMVKLTIVIGVSPLDFLDSFDCSCINNEVDKIVLIFTSDLKYLTF